MEKENNNLKRFVPRAVCKNSEDDDDETKWAKHYNNYKHMYRHWEWDDDEKRLFLIGYEKCGEDYESICRHYVRTRTYNQVVNYALNYFKSQKKTLIPEEVAGKILIPKEGVGKPKKRASKKDKTQSTLSKKNLLTKNSAPSSPKRKKKKISAPSLPTSTTTIASQDYTNNNLDQNHHGSSNINLLVPPSLSDYTNNNLDHKLIPSSSCDNIDDSIMPYDEPLYDPQFLQFESEFLPSSFVSDPSSFRMVEENQFNMASQDYTNDNLDHNHHDSSNINLLVPSSLSDYTYNNLDHKLVPSSSCDDIDDSILPYDEPLYDPQFLQFESEFLPSSFNINLLAPSSLSDYTNNNLDHNHHASSNNINLLDVPSSLSDYTNNNLDHNHQGSSNINLLVPSSSCGNIDDSIMPYDEPLYDPQFLQFESEYVPAFFNSSVSDPLSFRMVEENQFNMANQDYTNNNLDHNQHGSSNINLLVPSSLLSDYTNNNLDHNHHGSSNINLLDVPSSLSGYTNNKLDHNHHDSSNINLLVPSSSCDYTNNNLDHNHHASSNINLLDVPSSLSDYTNNNLDHKLVPSSSCYNIDDSIMPYDEQLYDLQFLQFESEHFLPSSSVSDPSSFRMVEENQFINTPYSPHHSCDPFGLWSWSSLKNYGNHFNMPSSSSVTPASDNAVNHNHLTNERRC